MYRNIVTGDSTNYVYVFQFNRRVGASSVVEALRASNPNSIVNDCGLFREDVQVEEGSSIVVVTSGYYSNEVVTKASRAYPGLVVYTVEEKSAYSDEYEELLKLRTKALQQLADTVTLADSVEQERFTKLKDMFI